MSACKEAAFYLSTFLVNIDNTCVGLLHTMVVLQSQTILISPKKQGQQFELASYQASEVEQSVGQDIRVNFYHTLTFLVFHQP